MNLRSMASSPIFVGSALACALAIFACSSKSPLPVDDGDDASSGDDATATSSGTGSGSGASSGSGSGTSSGTHVDSGTGSSSGSHDSGLAPGIPADAAEDAPSVIVCGSNPSCNLATQTCCVGQDVNMNPTGKCVAHGANCPLLSAAFMCGGASDCPSGQVCCGVADQNMGSAKTQCATTCPTMSTSSTQGQAQICKGDSECENGMKCIPQVCLGEANLNLCGLTSQAPFMCTAR